MPDVTTKELDNLIMNGLSLKSIHRITQISYRKISKRKREVIGIVAKYDRDLIIGLIDYNLRNPDIREIVGCSDHTIRKYRLLINKPSPRYIKSSFAYKEHCEIEEKIAPDAKLDELIKFGFTVDEIDSEYNYGRKNILERIKQMVLEDIEKNA